MTKLLIAHRNGQGYTSSLNHSIRTGSALALIRRAQSCTGINLTGVPDANNSPQGSGKSIMNLFEQQIAEIKISYSHKIRPKDQLKITASKDAYDYIRNIWPDIDYRESFAVLLMSRGNKILGINWISSGGISGTLVDVRLIFQSALKANAVAIILIHNHPSGTLEPSKQDLNITSKIKQGGMILDIDVLDHLIITSDSYVSLADEGLLHL